MAGALLPPAFLARLERLQLATRRPLAGRLGGEHRSPRTGSSVDFADERDYHPGDDFRHIDYALLARLDVLMVRLYEAEDDLTLRVLVDTSGSMAGAKLEHAKRVCAALGFVALVRRDAVVVHTFAGAARSPRFSGRSAVPALFAHLDSLTAAGTTPFVAATRRLLGQSGLPGITLVVSDLLTPEWADALRRLPARGGQVVVVHVLAPDDIAPDVSGDVEVVDRETGARVAVTATPDSLKAYRRRAEVWLDDVAARCRSVGAAYVRSFTTDDLEKTLLTAWRTHEVLR